MIISRTPFRISFAGGGTDLEDFWLEESGAVLSCAIDKYMYVTVNRRFDDTIRVSYSKTEIVEHIDDIQHPIVREALRFVGIEHGLEITSIGDVPSGTGLGSSSSFTVGLLNALYRLKGDRVSPERLARDACRLEVEVLKEPIGKQDQYIAAYGGLRYIGFHPDGTVSVDRVVVPEETSRILFDNLMLFYTGIRRKSHTILSEQKRAVPEHRNALRLLRDLAARMRDLLAGGRDLDEFGRMLHESWLLKKTLAASISPAGIDDLYQRARNAGALGGKLLGAGGGGFLLLYVAGDGARARVRKTFNGLRELHVALEPGGSSLIYGGD